eukprot:TRINITY_DN32487_c0_g1_i1.p1 TRINITY_DN32487_c0_g1~~TRINITY_DN32487_c0_g1_i1.p1  ORF type:complete len:219 (+),score=30.00 TRINITY_DN32487_c0_g1_i1:76-732(+)
MNSLLSGRNVPKRSDAFAKRVLGQCLAFNRVNERFVVLHRLRRQEREEGWAPGEAHRRFKLWREAHPKPRSSVVRPAVKSKKTAIRKHESAGKGSRSAKVPPRLSRMSKPPSADTFGLCVDLSDSDDCPHQDAGEDSIAKMKLLVAALQKKLAEGRLDERHMSSNKGSKTRSDKFEKLQKKTNKLSRKVDKIERKARKKAKKKAVRGREDENGIIVLD